MIDTSESCIGDAVELAVDDVGVERRGIDGLLEVGLVLADVLDVARLDLRAHHAAGPGIDDVGAVVGLEQRRELGLVGLVLHVIDDDLHARMRCVVVLRHLLPEGIARRVDVEQMDGHVVGERRAQC